MWGFNHLLFLPPAYLWIFGGLVLVIMVALFTRPPGESLAAVFNTVSEYLFSGRYRLKWAIIAIALIPALYLLRLTLYVLGDSASLIDNLNADLPVIFKWSEVGAIYTVYAFSKLLIPLGVSHAAYSYVVISFLSGAVSVWFFFAIASRLANENADRLLILSLMAFAGWGLLFFGYVENYPILWPFVTGYIYFAIKVMKREGSLIWPIILFVIALVLHLQSFFLVLSLAVLIINRITGTHFYKKYYGVLRIFLILLIVGGIAAFAGIYLSSYEFRLYVIPLLGGRQTTLDYWLFSPKHLIDIVNQFLLLIPVIPLLLYFMPWKKVKPFQNNLNNFLFWLTIGGLGFLFAIEPKLGMGRDWDLFALCCLGLLLYIFKNIFDHKALRRKMYPVLVLLSLTFVFPFYGSYIRDKSALKSYEYLLALDLPRSRTGLVQLYIYYSSIKDSINANQVKQIISTNFPSHTLIPEALDLIDQERFTEATEIADKIAQYDSESAEYLNLRGMIYSRQGKFDSALAYLEPAARLGRYDYRFPFNLSAVYRRMKRYDEELDVLRQSQKLAPDNPNVLKALMVNFFMTRQYDSAAAYARQIFARDSSPDAVYILGFSSFQMRQGKAAESYFKKYLEIGDDDRKLKQVADFLERLKEMKAQNIGLR